MTRPAKHRPLFSLIAVAGLCLSMPAFAQVDAEAAEKVFKDNDCHKCHHPSRAKKGPALKKIAAKYKEKNLDEKEAIKHMTSGQKVKLDDGKEEDHKIIDTKDVKVQTNVAKWILSH